MSRSEQGEGGRDIALILNAFEYFKWFSSLHKNGPSPSHPVSFTEPGIPSEEAMGDPLIFFVLRRLELREEIQGKAGPPVKNSLLHVFCTEAPTPPLTSFRVSLTQYE